MCSHGRDREESRHDSEGPGHGLLSLEAYIEAKSSEGLAYKGIYRPVKVASESSGSKSE